MGVVAVEDTVDVVAVVVVADVADVVGAATAAGAVMEIGLVTSDTGTGLVT